MKISHPKKANINSVTTLLFDWGGVITPIDPQKAMNEFRRLGHPSIEKYFEPDMKDDLLRRLEIGQLTPQEVWQCLQKDFETPVKPQLLEKAYCTLLLETPEIRIRLLQNLQADFELYLLSNTNIVHTSYYEEVLKQRFQLDFPILFKKLFYSNLMGLRKPGRKIFDQLISETGLSPENTLFLDDSQENIDTALSLGIKALLVSDTWPIERIFREWL